MHGHLGGVGKLLKSRPSGTENNSMGQIKKVQRKIVRAVVKGSSGQNVCCLLIRYGCLLSNFNKMVTFAGFT